jgi:hypothetical protein
MTDTSKDAVARLCLAMINSGNTTTANMLNALADERDRLATAHTQLQVSLSAANARADQARDAALVEAAGTLEVQALDTDAQAKRFRGGSDPWADRTARSRALRNSAAAILALRDKPAPAVTALDQLSKLTFAIQHNPNCPSPWLIRTPGKSLVIDLKPYASFGPTEDGYLTNDQLHFGKTFEEAALRAIAGGGDE